MNKNLSTTKIVMAKIEVLVVKRRWRPTDEDDTKVTEILDFFFETAELKMGKILPRSRLLYLQKRLGLE